LYLPVELPYLVQYTEVGTCFSLREYYYCEAFTFYAAFVNDDW